MRKPEAGEIIHGQTVAVPPSRYENEAWRGVIEAATREALAARIGLDAEEVTWHHEPAHDHVDEETGDTFHIPETWRCVAEAVGPIELAVQ